MLNRLDDIKGAEEETAVALDGQTEDIEMAPVPASEEMKKFFNEVEDVKATIQYVRERTKEIHKLQDQALNAFRAEESSKTSDELEKVLQDANKRLGDAKQVLAKMKADTEELKKNGSASEVRIRENMYQTLTQNFVSAVRSFQQAQQTYKTKMKSKVARQVQIVKPDATMEEIDKVMKSGDPGAIYRAAILQPGCDPVAQAYLDVHAKYQDVLRLEESVKALNQLFKDMALLVERQGELLNQVEFNVVTAAEHVVKGTDNLKRAHKARKAIRKKYMIIAAICIIIIIVIVLVVLK